MFRTYVRCFLGVFFVILLAVVTTNIVIDPLWFFEFSSKFNRNQVGFDERQQKTNRVVFGDFPYDAVLLGSSRVTYIDQRDFAPWHLFNYAVSGEHPREYSGYLSLVRARLGKPIPVIVIGVDFFASSRNHGLRALDPASYRDKAQRPFYRFEALLSADTLKRSLKNIQMRKVACDCYSRDNVKSASRPTQQEKSEIFDVGLKKFQRDFYGETYVYDENLASIWKQIITENPGSRFIVFTTPISAPLFKLMLECGRLEDFERWERDLINNFGEIYDFMGINTVTSNLDNYQDSGHFYPSVGRLIAARILNHGNNVPEDFGIRVRRNNLTSHIAHLAQQALRRTKSN